jgi:hypothetical protein
MLAQVARVTKRTAEQLRRYNANSIVALSLFRFD